MVVCAGASDPWRQAVGDPTRAQLAAFATAIVAVWLGLLNSAREIVKERAILDRECHAGLRMGAYLASKAVPLSVLAGAQCMVLVGLVMVRAKSSGVGLLLPALPEPLVPIM